MPANVNPSALMVALFGLWALVAPLPAWPDSSSVVLGETADFEFHAQPGISTHHFVHQWARWLEYDGDIDPRLLPGLGVDPGQGTPMLSPTAGERWLAAVDFYREHWVDESLVFSSRNQNVLDQVRAGGLADPEADGDLHVLQGAHEVYVSTWWPEHEKAIRDYFRNLEPMVARHGECIADGIRRAYGGWLPEGERMRVDFAYVTNWAGAYTTGDPVVLHVAVSDRLLQGTLGLEMMYHEASHGHWVQPRIEEIVDKAFQAQHAAPPDRFWHIVLFHTAGTLTRQCLEASDGPDHERYAEAAGPAQRASWRPAWTALDQQWGPFLSGQTDDRQAAMEAVAAAYISASNKPINR